MRHGAEALWTTPEEGRRVRSFVMARVLLFFGIRRKKHVLRNRWNHRVLIVVVLLLTGRL